jgi:4-hydroxybenzoate polyprenyltransferase
VGARTPATWSPLASSLRPGQWTKNLLVFAGLIFGGRLLDPASVMAAASAFAIFCALSSAGYLFNDVRDREGDRRHPLKQGRPVASGELSSSTAMAAGAVLAGGGLIAATAMTPAFVAVAGAYVLLVFLYSVLLKYIVIIDVLAVAGGFVLRAIAGAVAIAVPFSAWLLVCTTLLALFLGLSKRRHELVLLGDAAIDHRRILHEYSPYLLDQMIAVVTASTLIAYAFYAISAETAARLGTARLGLTIPFVLYGIFRYLYLVHQKRGGGSPAAMLVTDRPLLVCVGLWIATVATLLYTPLGK